VSNFSFIRVSILALNLMYQKYTYVMAWQASLIYPDLDVVGAAIHLDPIRPARSASCSSHASFALRSRLSLTPVATWVVLYIDATNTRNVRAGIFAERCKRPSALIVLCIANHAQRLTVRSAKL
jgi:hypothetical protein